MTKIKRKGLGRGLDALLSANTKPVAEGQQADAKPASKDGMLTELPVEFLQRNWPNP